MHADSLKNARRILVIDDDPSVRQSLAQMLKSGNYEALLAGSGKEGAALCREAQPDLAIVDIFMPDQDGIEVIAAFRREFPRLPVIAVSGGHLTSGSMLSAAKKLGAARVLEKPFSVEVFLKTIDEILRV